MSNLVKQAQNLKLKDAVPALTKHAQEQWTPSKLQGRFVTWRDAYKKKYIDTGSPRPLYELMIYGFFLSYAISWPNEYRHLKHAEASKLHGEAQKTVAV